MEGRDRMGMAETSATDRMQRELDRALAALRGDLDRIELLTAALVAFSGPVPEYEPTFRHVNAVTLGAHELGSRTQD
jgi:hypothetical protein